MEAEQDYQEMERAVIDGSHAMLGEELDAVARIGYAQAGEQWHKDWLAAAAARADGRVLDATRLLEPWVEIAKRVREAL